MLICQGELNNLLVFIFIFIIVNLNIEYFYTKNFNIFI
jgi:hypothetical protein